MRPSANGLDEAMPHEGNYDPTYRSGPVPLRAIFANARNRPGFRAETSKLRGRR